MKYLKIIFLALVCLGLSGTAGAELYRTVKEQTPYYTDQACTVQGGFLTQGNVISIENEPINGVLEYSGYETMYLRVNDLELISDEGFVNDSENVGDSESIGEDTDIMVEPDGGEENIEEESFNGLIFWLIGLTIFMAFAFFTRRKNMSSQWMRWTMAGIGVLEYFVFLNAPALIPEEDVQSFAIFWIIAIMAVFIFAVQLTFLKWNADRGINTFILILYVLLSMGVAISINKGIYQFGNHLIGNMIGLGVYVIMGIIIFQKKGVMRTLMNMLPFAICGIGMGSLIPHIIWPICLYLTFLILPLVLFYAYVTDKGSSSKDDYNTCSYCAYWIDGNCYKDGHNQGGRGGGDSCGSFTSK